MKNLVINLSQHLPFVFSHQGTNKMLYVNLKKFLITALWVFVCSSILFAADSHAEELFGDLAKHGGKIFTGMREIIYAVSGFGIIAIVIGAIFGQINYKWLAAILIGLFVIAATAAIINYMVDEDVVKPEMITDSLKTGQ